MSSKLVRRLIGESDDYPESETRTYEITAWPEHLDELERFFWWINSTRSGHSGSAELYVDGDGAACVEISRKGAALQKPKEEVHPSSGRGPEYKVCLESQEKPLMVEKGQRVEEFHVCPHCKQEIYEKHTYIDGDFMSGNYITRHSDCKGAIEFPESIPLDEIADWLRPSVEQARKQHAAFLASL